MGRNRLPLKRLTSANRRIAYSRRKKGLMKKARELSVLCDVEVFLVTFSPGGKPTVFITENSSIEDVIEKFAQLKPEERAKKKLECLEVVKKACKKFDHHVDIGELFYPGDLSDEDLTSLADSLRTRLSDTQNRLSHWMNIDKISNTDQLGKMEESLINSLQDIQRHKNGLLAQQLKRQCSDELQHVTDLPIGMVTSQVLQPSSWTQNGINPNINFDNDLNLTQGCIVSRLPECSSESYTNLFCFDKEVEVTRPSGEDRTNPLLDYEHMQHYFQFQSAEENVVSCFQYLSPETTEFPSFEVTDKSLEEVFENSGNHFSDGFLSSFGVDSQLLMPLDTSFHECTVTDSNPTTWGNKYGVIHYSKVNRKNVADTLQGLMGQQKCWAILLNYPDLNLV
ncbi:agamous-like MADS-box protein AGL30 isoform X2 [Ipomoea triloba]|uniref:agamous-like MADS-box protein AGL30 isoform X2 n=1 Tax=Ipomoea triloba TaxID=35885 RepID=UPI00125E6354|nr:agamous-like MADS-box protein AGL30 isoform X2 [Ipomoea triloba]